MDRILLPSPDFENRVKIAPQSIFAQKAFVPLRLPAFLPFMAHHNIFICVRVTARNVKKSVFH